MTDKTEDEPRKTKRWTAALEEAFLAHLAATCNVGVSCATINMAQSTAYLRRRRDPAFAAAWRAAILTGYDRLEAMLLALAGAATRDAETAVEDGKVDPQLAMQLLGLHHARLKAEAAGTAKAQNRVSRATPEQTDAAILKQLAALDRRLKAKRGA